MKGWLRFKAVGPELRTPQYETIDVIELHTFTARRKIFEHCRGDFSRLQETRLGCSKRGTSG